MPANPLNLAAQSADPLAGLRDIHLPAAVSWWPPALGWWLLAATILMLIVALLFYWRWRNNKAGKTIVFSTHDSINAALLELTRLEHQCAEKHEHTRRMVAEASQLLRRCAMQLSSHNGLENSDHKPDAVAGLTGSAWLDWLDARWSRSDFNQSAGRLLLEAPYRNTSPSHTEIDELLSIMRAWLEQQR